EEQQLIPAFRRAFPEEAAEICTEHAQLRRRLGELAVKFDLRTFRHEHALAFVAALRDHADKEAAFLYAWAAEHLPQERAQALGEHLETLSRQVAAALEEAPLRD
ncbi:MAG TPA: hypothetical protein VGF45_15620, partial [Polyangia bacterium]